MGKIRLISCSLDGGECSVSSSGHFTTRYLGGPRVPSASNEVGRFADVDRSPTYPLFHFYVIVAEIA